MMKLRLPTAPTRLFLELHDHEALKQRAQEHSITHESLGVQTL
jgi:hypothetical protein